MNGRSVVVASCISWRVAIDFAARCAETNGGAGYRYAVRKAPGGRWVVIEAPR